MLTIFLSICTAAISSMPYVCALPRGIIKVTAPLLENVVVERQSLQQFSNAASIMMTWWIFVAIVITTCYKSKMKSNYMIEQKFTTKWKSLRDIQNFTLIFAESMHDNVEKLWHGAISREYLVWKKRLDLSMGEPCDENCVLRHEPLFWNSMCVLIQGYDERFACEIFQLQWYAAYYCFMRECPNDDKFREWLRSYSSLLQNMARHSMVRPFGRIREVIREELLRPRTAFVSPAESFDADWKIFEEESKILHVRFAHSEQAEDFGSMFGYELTSGFNQHLGNRIYVRGLKLMESGIFWMWKKWEAIRRDFNSRNISLEKAFVELSFRNSDLHLIFVVYAVCIFVAMISVGLEYLWLR